MTTRQGTARLPDICVGGLAMPDSNRMRSVRGLFAVGLMTAASVALLAQTGRGRGQGGDAGRGAGAGVAVSCRRSRAR